MQEKTLSGVVMEIQDCAYPLLAGVVATTDVTTAFSGVDVACLVGGFPRLKGMERKDLMDKNASIFVEQGRALRQFASPNVKVLVVANPANSNCLVAVQNACLDPNGVGKPLPKENFTCLTRLDQNRARHQIATRFGVASTAVKNVIIWGNHSSTLFPDLEHAFVATSTTTTTTTNAQTTESKSGSASGGSGGGDSKAATANTTSSTVSVVTTAHKQLLSSLPEAKQKLSTEWLEGVSGVGGFVRTVQQRGAAVIEARGLSSALSAANAIADHLRDWLYPTAGSDEFVSMGVYSDGSAYGIASDIIYSFPVKCQAGGTYTIVKDLVQSAYAKNMCKITETELLDEKKLLPPIGGAPTPAAAATPAPASN